TPVAVDLVLTWIEEENARRVEAGDSPIRVISGSTVAAEKMAGELAGLAMNGCRSAARDVARALATVLPVARPARLSEATRPR
ncbi:MAG TPA: hypothetical protein VFG83_06845, partial [Kofleriaceae bacterium]|nr:hypothetical protein [Kofleriaceae bacterium]